MTKSEFQYRLKLTVLTILAFASAGLLLFSYAEDSSPHFFAGLLLLGACVWIKLKWKVQHPDDSYYYEEGDAYWSDETEFFNTNNPDPDSNRAYWIGGRQLRSCHAHGIVIGGSGCGKTTSRLIPAALLKPFGSLFFVDVKGEICFTTARYQAEHNRVFILDVWDVQSALGARHGIKASCLNSFDFIKQSGDAELIDMCASIAYFLCPDKPADKDPFWVERSRSLIKVCMAHILTGMPESDHNFYTLYKVLRYSGIEFTNFLLDMKRNKSLDLISIAASEWLGMQEAEGTLRSILSNAQNATSIFESPQLRYALSRSDFDLYDLAKEGNTTVYLVVPERYLDSHAGFLRLIVGLALKAVNARPGNPVAFHIDEMPALKKFDILKHNFAFGRGQGISITIYAQSVAALKEIYGDAWESFVANAALFQVFRGARDMATQKFTSALLGQRTVRKTSHSKSTSTSQQGSSSGTSSNTTTEKRALLSPEEVGTGNGIITIADGKKKILLNTPYYKNIYDGLTEQELTPEEKTKLKKDGKLVDEYYEHFMAKADIPLNFM